MSANFCYPQSTKLWTYGGQKSRKLQILGEKGGRGPGSPPNRPVTHHEWFCCLKRHPTVHLKQTQHLKRSKSPHLKSWRRRSRSGAILREIANSVNIGRNTKNFFLIFNYFSREKHMPHLETCSFEPNQDGGENLRNITCESICESMNLCSLQVASSSLLQQACGKLGYKWPPKNYSIIQNEWV